MQQPRCHGQADLLGCPSICAKVDPAAANARLEPEAHSDWRACSAAASSTARGECLVSGGTPDSEAAPAELVSASARCPPSAVGVGRCSSKLSACSASGSEPGVSSVGRARTASASNRCCWLPRVPAGSCGQSQSSLDYLQHAVLTGLVNSCARCRQHHLTGLKTRLSTHQRCKAGSWKSLCRPVCLLMQRWQPG